MIALKLVYAANVLVAGWVGVSSLFFPQTAQQTVFSGAIAFSESIRLVGALWSAIAVLSLIGLLYPRQMVPVLVLQVIYKGAWLLVAALPALLNGQPYPKNMALFFLVWVLVLPWVIPWKALFAG